MTFSTTIIHWISAVSVFYLWVSLDSHFVGPALHSEDKSIKCSSIGPSLISSAVLVFLRSNVKSPVYYSWWRKHSIYVSPTAQHSPWSKISNDSTLPLPTTSLAETRTTILYWCWINCTQSSLETAYTQSATHSAKKFPYSRSPYSD